MELKNPPVDSFGIPSWIGAFCDQHQIRHLQGMRTYRLLMVIFTAIIEMGIPEEASEENREEELLAFKTWFLKLGQSAYAHAAIRRVHRQAKCKRKGKSTEDLGQDDRDRQLSYILEVFFSILERRENDPSVERYFEMVSEGWANGEQDGYRESLYRGLIAILLAYAYYDLAPAEEHPVAPEWVPWINQTCAAAVLKLSPSLAWQKVQAEG